jgi:Ca2+-binding EF-hand superfamily protein
MKRILLFALLIAGLKMNAQEKLLDVLPMKDGKVYYEEVVTIDSASKNELYNRAKMGIVSMYKSAKDVIQLDDKETGEIIAKGNFQATWTQAFMVTQSTYVSHTLTVFVKDNKAKIVLTDFRVKYYYQHDVDMTLEEFCSRQKIIGKSI